MGTKITALTTLASADDADVFPIVDVDASATKKITWAALKAGLSNIGKTQRAQFSYKDADEIYAGAGYYDCDGKVAFWSSQLTLQLSGAGADTWYYVYLDYSAITSGVALTATEIIFSATPPTWSAAKHSWYNGSDRCIFAVLTDGSNNILEFFHDGGSFVGYADQIADQELTDIDVTWTDVTLSIPGFCTSALCTFYASGGDTSVTIYYRTNGQSGSTGHTVGQKIASRGTSPTNTMRVFTDSSQKIEVKHSQSTAATSGTNTNGWFFPIGM